MEEGTEMNVNALLNWDLKDFAHLDYFSFADIDHSDSFVGAELVADNDALDQWRRAMASINQALMVKRN